MQMKFYFINLTTTLSTYSVNLIIKLVPRYWIKPQYTIITFNTPITTLCNFVQDT